MTPCRLKELITMGFTHPWSIKVANRVYATQCPKQAKVFGTRLRRMR